MSPLPLLPVLLLLPQLHGFTVDEPGQILPMDARPARRHLERQARSRAQLPWRGFLERDGRGWRAMFHEESGLPWRAWGPGISMDTTSAARLEADLRKLLANHPGLVGGLRGSLKLASMNHVERTDTWYVTFQQYHGVYPVHGAALEARVAGGALVMLRVSLEPSIPSLSPPVLSGEDALAVVLKAGPAPGAGHVHRGSSLTVVPLGGARDSRFRLAWQVETDTGAPPGIWTTWVDASTGDVLGVENLVRTSGQVLARHDIRYPGDAMAVSPVAHATVTSPSSAVFSDDDGHFYLDGDSFNTWLSGDYLRVVNRAGSPGELSMGSGGGTWDTTSATQSEIDSYIFLEQVRRWGARFGPEVSFVNRSLTSYVLDSSISCNAYFDGNVNFGPANSTCNDTARIADVNYHEWGHGFHWYSLEAGSFDSAAGEGIADSIALLQTGDPVLAPYFIRGDPSGIRDLSSGRVYPDDWVGQPHTDGLILGGAVYDLLLILQERLGEEEGWEVTSQLLADALKAGFSIPEAYYDFVAADDDDGDLSNGTPNICAIAEAFALHGLGPGGELGLVTMEHVTMENQGPDDAHYLEAVVVEIAPECSSFPVVGGIAHWSIDGGETWDELELALEPDESGALLWGELPRQPAGSTVLYYIEAWSEDEHSIAVPSGRTINPFSFFVGDYVVLYEEDFEEGDGGYNHMLVEGEDELGADDWQHGTPQGMGGDPAFAWSGATVWGNDLGDEGWNGEYQNDRWNRLTSGPISVAPYSDLLVQFRRWLTVEDGYYDQARVLLGGDVVWANHATSRQAGDEHHLDEQWALASLRVEDDDLDGFIELSWEIQSDAGLTMGGWNIDDVTVLAPASPRNLLTVTDLEAGDEGSPALTWTNPVYEGLREVVVVMRRDGRFPTSVEDGSILARLSPSEPGVPVTLAPEADEEGEAWFAVFATDGDETWSVGAYEGYNAAEGWTTLPAVEGEYAMVGPPGCGCAPGGGKVSPVPLVLLLGALGISRRRSPLHQGTR